jgi:SAM-dependent methyltransferase
MDISQEFDLDVVGDFRKMPFADRSFDVIVFDPPHLPDDAGTTGTHQKYNVGNKGLGLDGDNISAVFPIFLAEAKRVLKPNGLVLAKLADLVHNHRQQWQQVDFINAVRASGMTPCDMLIKIDPSAGNLADARWKNVRHLRKQHCYWIVVRNSDRCECRKKG